MIQTNIFSYAFAKINSNIRKYRLIANIECFAMIIVATSINAYSAREHQHVLTSSGSAQTFPPNDQSYRHGHLGHRQLTALSTGQYITFILTLTITSSAASPWDQSQSDRAILTVAIAKAMQVEPNGCATVPLKSPRSSCFSIKY